MFRSTFSAIFGQITHTLYCNAMLTTQTLDKGRSRNSSRLVFHSDTTEIWTRNLWVTTPKPCCSILLTHQQCGIRKQKI